MKNESIEQVRQDKTAEAEWDSFLGRRSPEAENVRRIEEGPLPDWCNLGVTLRVILVVNLIFAAITGLQSISLVDALQSMMTVAVTLEPVLIASLFAGCALRRLLLRAPAALQIVLTLLIPALLTFAIQNVLIELLQISRSRILLNALMAGVLCAVVLYWLYLRMLAYSPALSEARLQALQSRIRPHFLFNSLNAVLGLIRSDPRHAETAIEDLADLFRVLMRDSRERVPLREEVALCKQYLSIESLRLGDRLQVEWHVDDSATHALVPTLLLQPLIENAVHHGIEPVAEKGKIRIEIKRSGAYVDILIANPVCNPEIVQSRLHTGNQIGLDNVRQRLALVHDLEARIETVVADGLFVVKMQLPIQTK